jgi:hypothetical protein
MKIGATSMFLSLVKTVRLQGGRWEFRPMKKFFVICRDELDRLRRVPEAQYSHNRS